MSVTPAFKVVQQVDNRYFSVNPIGIQDIISTPSRWPFRSLVEYQLDKVTRPYKTHPFIFVVENMAQAKKAVPVYGAVNTVIMKGIGMNVQSIDQDWEFPNRNGDFLLLPRAFKSAVCDWFLPLEIVQ